MPVSRTGNAKRNGKYRFSSVIFSYTVIYFSLILFVSLLIHLLSCFEVPCERFVVQLICSAFSLSLALSKDAIRIHISQRLIETDTNANATFTQRNTCGLAFKFVSFFSFKVSHLFFALIFFFELRHSSIEPKLKERKKTLQQHKLYTFVLYWTNIYRSKTEHSKQAAEMAK